MAPASDYNGSTRDSEDEMELLILTTVAFALIMAAMAVGVLLSNRSLRGSCGGTPMLGPDGDPLSCPDCNCKAPVVEIGEPVSEHGA